MIEPSDWAESGTGAVVGARPLLPAPPSPPPEGLRARPGRPRANLKADLRWAQAGYSRLKPVHGPQPRSAGLCAGVAAAGMSSAQRRECPRPTLPPRALPPPSGPHRTPTSAMDWRVRPDNITTAADFWALWDADQDAFAAIGLTLGAERSGGASICSIVRRPRPPLPPPPRLRRATAHPASHSRRPRAPRMGHCCDHG